MAITKVTGMMQTSTKGGDIPSASPTVIDTDGDYFDVTGTTNFAAFTVTAGRRFTVQFDGALTMTHHATTLDLPGAANITTAAGDVAEFFATGTNTVQCVNYTKADGTAVVAGASGDLRNFIIDGDFTQWPEGTAATTIANNDFGGALYRISKNNDGTATVERSTDVPTVAESGHQSPYSMLFKCTGTDASIDASHYLFPQYTVTGSDFAYLHQQEVTLSFWAKTSSQNSGDTFYWSFQNSAGDRSYVKNFTATSSWTKFSFTLTLDTSGTWLFTEADKGLRINFSLIEGSNADDGTIGSWVAGSERWDSSTAISNFLDHTSNEFYISQVSLVLGSTAPTFLGEPASVVKHQVGYYIQRTDLDQGGDEEFKSGWAVGANTIRIMHWFIPEMRVAPTMSNEAAGNYELNDGVTIVVGNTIAYQTTTTQKTRINIAEAGTSITAGRASVIQRDDTDTAFFMADARH
jgi:hypothetical protein